MVSTIINEKKRSREIEKNYKERKTSRYERKINKAKLKSREELDLFDWNKWKFSEKDFWIDPYVDTLDRIDSRKVSKQEFIDQYEKPNIPVVITHGTDDWKANEYWNEKYFLERYGKELYKVGEDDDGNNVYMKMKHFLYYCQHDAMTDDSPLYIFDSGFYKDRKKKKSSNNKKSKSSSSSDDDDNEKDHQCNNNNIKKQKLESTTTSTSPSSLLNDYEVPHYFDDDLFQLTGSRRRPPYRWLVVGPARSGTGIHTDPLGTSAWNALLKGHKRWALFPPGTSKKLIDPPMKPYDHEGVSWFSQVFPKFRKRDDPNDIRTLGERLGMIEVLQRPGEIIFVPGGWDHVVMNLDLTIAVTQNYCSPTNLEYVYLSTRHSRPKLGAKLLRQIEKLGINYPDSIYSILSKQLNTLKYTPQIPPSSSSDSDSSTSSSSSSSSGSSSSSFIVSSSKDNNNNNQLTKKKKIIVSSTDSETDLSDGTCMCQKCKMKRKKKEKLKKKTITNNNNNNNTTTTN